MYIKLLTLFAVMAFASSELQPISPQAESARLRRSSSVRITGLSAYDQGSHGDGARRDVAIDVTRTACRDSSDEPFFNTVVGISLSSSLHTYVRFNKILFIIPRAGTDGRRVRTRRLAPIDGFELGALDSGEVLGFFLELHDGGKAFIGSTDTISEDLGTRKVTVRMWGRDSSGKRIKVVGRTSLIFREVDRCS